MLAWHPRRVARVEAVDGDHAEHAARALLLLVALLAPAASLAVEPVTKNIGCLDGDSIQEVGGQLLFLAPDGIRKFSNFIVPVQK